MSAISMGLSNTAPSAPSNTRTSLILTGLTDGAAQPGDLLRVRLSNGVKIETHAWGSTPGGSDYGTQPTLTVPDGTVGRVLHVTAYTGKRQFASLVYVVGTPTAVTDIRPGPDAILIESLSLRLEPALKPSANAEAIIVEID